MAFIPDEAIADSHELQPVTFRLYACICAARNKKLGGYWLPFERVKQRISITEPSFFRARRELIEKGWVEDRGKHFLVPLKGFPAINSDSTTAITAESETVNSSNLPINSESVVIKTDSSTINTNSAHIRKHQSLLPTISPNIDHVINQVTADFPNDDRRLVEIAILNAMIRRREGQINDTIRSTKYFHREVKTMIDEAKGLSSDTIDVALAKRRQQYFGENAA